MSIRISYEDDGAMVVTCGDQSLRIAPGTDEKIDQAPPQPKEGKPQAPVNWGVGATRFMTSRGADSIKSWPEISYEGRWDVAVLFHPSSQHGREYITIQRPDVLYPPPGRRLVVIVGLPTGMDFDPGTEIDRLKRQLTRTFGIQARQIEFSIVPVRQP